MYHSSQKYQNGKRSGAQTTSKLLVAHAFRQPNIDQNTHTHTRTLTQFGMGSAHTHTQTHYNIIQVRPHGEAPLSDEDMLEATAQSNWSCIFGANVIGAVCSSRMVGIDGKSV